MTNRFLRACAALITLLVVAIGVPLALTRWGHWPIDGIPTWEQIRALTDTIVSDTAVFGLMTLVAWAIWALFMCSVVVEAAAELTGRAAPNLPFAAPLQRNARRLVAATLMTASVLGPLTRVASAQLLVPAEPVTLVPPPSAPAPAPSHHEVPAATPLIDPASAPIVRGPEIEVGRGDNPWDLASRHLGDPMRWREIWDLNRGVPQHDGRAWVVPDVIELGWRLQLPSDAVDVPSTAPVGGTSEYTVRPNDTLSDIAEEQLGDELRAMELFDLNQGRLQLDGDSLRDPDLIRPGWNLSLPEPQAAAAPAPPSVPAPPISAPSVPAPPPAPEPALTPAPSTTTPDRGTPAPPRSIDQHDDGEPAQLPLGLIGGGVATAGLLLLLERRRRAQHRHRGHGERIVLPSAELQTTERELRAGAADDVARYLDAAMRAAASADTAQLAFVEASSEQATLTLTAAAEPPDGFVRIDPHGWNTAASLSELSAFGASAASPAPALTPIGTTATGTEILIDLEGAPVTIIDGNSDRASELLTSIAGSLINAPWAANPRVLVVGADEHLAGLPGVETMPSLSEALDLALERADRAATALQSIGSANTVSARAAGSTPDAWEPLIVVSLIPPDDSEAEAIATLAERPHMAVGVTCPATTTALPGRVIHIDDAGMLRMPGLDAPGVRARGLPNADTRAVADLLATAADLESTTLGDLPTPSDRPPHPVLDLRNLDIDGDPAEAPARLPMLQADIDVLVRVLGDVEAARLRDDGEERLSVTKQRALEAITYLALRDSSVDREDVQAALWPNGANSAKTFSNAIWEARRVLGAGRDSIELFPDASEGRYTLSDRVVTDYGLFCELTSLADQIDGAQRAADLLTEALTLVRGEPFTGVGRSYAWVGPHRGIIVAQIVDAAEELAEVRLATSDWRGAEWAARQGLRAMPCDERMYRLLMRAAHAAGNVPGVHRAFSELCDAVADPDDGAEPDDTVHPDTITLLEQLTTSPRSPRVSA